MSRTFAVDDTGPYFVDRQDAGLRLARRLANLADERPAVLALPRGGVAVAAPIARSLGAPLDILVVRKLGCPGQPELGIGAIAEGGVQVLNEPLIAEVGITPAQIADVARSEQAELARRVARYRGGRRRLELAGRTTVLVDDGLATGYTASAAVASARLARARRVVVAVPVAPADTIASLRQVADEVEVLVVAEWFFAIGEFYADFSQVTDEEVVGLLEASLAPRV